jgi:isoleucyl-tRNA synthetase
MAFQDVPNKVDFPAQEREVLKYWKESGAFEQLRKLRKGEPAWSFIDGPITANNPMGAHHGWGRTYKDLMQRFRAMQGHELRYQNGFDCQGLWVEVEVEKEQGYGSKKDIETKGLEHFVRLCKSRVLKYSSVQTDQSIRLGYWMDWNDTELLRRLADLLLENPAQQITLDGPKGPVTGSVEELVGRLGMPELGGSYYTFSTENNYMIWNFLKKCWQNDWLYRGVDVMPWCPRCATGISQHEIVTDGYSEVTHRSVTVRFPLLDAQGGRRVDAERGLPESLLAWTTTPWTLTSNVAAAVGAELVYARVRQGEQIYYLAKGTLHMLKGEYELLGEVLGKDLVGLKYSGPFDELDPANRPGGFTHLKENELKRTTDLSAKQAHQVIHWDAVGETEGTGIVHIAPGCGAEDFELGREYNLPLVAPLDDEGVFVDGFGWLSGMKVAEVADPIFKSLESKGVLYKVSNYTHRYPTCWRCKTELVFRLVDEWFISMGEVYDTPRAELSAEQKARSLRYQIMDVVDQIRWIPDFGHAREMDWLRNMHDWMISKKRYWGLALPIWTCEECGHFEVIGDEVELKSRAVAGWETFEGHTPHRPFVDAVELECPNCHGHLKRVPDVGNPWLDAGVVPFSTLSYRADPQVWQKWYPAQWITESFPGQFRNWFYSLLAMATVLDQSPPFMQNFGFATLLGEDGRAMHKSWGNSIEFNEAADKMGVDVMRWLYASQKPENDLLFGYHRGDEARRQFMIPLWNAYSFFVTYANLDGWAPQGEFDLDYPEGPRPESENLLDRWVLARLNQAVAKVTDNFNVSDFYAAVAALDAMIDDLTNWYVRRSRRRFWKSEHDQDKNAAYSTLYHVLVKMARLMAPVTPFVTEAIYQNLVRGTRPEAHGSIHHTRWPRLEIQAEDENLLEQMGLARQVASLGLGARSASNLKVRQPLSKVMVFAASGRGLSSLRTLRTDMVDIIIDELNVKAFEYVEDEGKLVNYRILPDSKILGPKLGNLFPKVRAALTAENPLSVASRVHAGENITLTADGQTVELLASEILVQTSPREGLAVASDKGVTVAIDANLTPELRAEGTAREIVRRVQDMRKKAGFQIEDRIHSFYQLGDAASLREVFQNWASYLCAETLSLAMTDGAAPEGAYVEAQDIEGEQVILGVIRAQA